MGNNQHLLTKDKQHRLKEKREYRYVVICQLFYPDEINGLLDVLSILNRNETLFVFNIGTFDKSSVIEAIKKRFEQYLIYENPQKGRDIGAKLFLINAILNLGITAEYALMVHDKKSPHLSNGSGWRNDLLKILEPKNLNRVQDIFKDPEIGVIASLKFIENEYDPITKKFKCRSNHILKHLIKEMKWEITDYRFVAGCIFLIRFEILKNSFSDPGSKIINIISSLEFGNVLDFNKGTFIHSWERLFSWLATSQGYRIYGIH